MTACIECGKDVLYLDDLGVGPNICGYCKQLLCPTCDGHTACAPHIRSHNSRVELRKAEVRLSQAEADVARLRKDVGTE